MGFLDRLRGGNVEIALTLDRDEVSPGEALTVRIDVSGELDEKSRGIRVSLKCTGGHKERDMREEHDVDWHFNVLHAAEHELPAAIGAATVSFTVPPDAAPTSGREVEWEVEARVDRERGMDKVAREDVVVVRAPEQIPASRGADPSNEGLTLVGVAAGVAERESLSGTLVVELLEDLEVAGVAVRLRRRCTYLARMINDEPGSLKVGSLKFKHPLGQLVESEEVAEAELAGKQQFAAGRREQFDFAIEVPLEGPTTEHPHATVEWLVEGVLNRRLRGDLTVEAPLYVYGASSTA